MAAKVLSAEIRDLGIRSSLLVVHGVHGVLPPQSHGPVAPRAVEELQKPLSFAPGSMPVIGLDAWLSHLGYLTRKRKISMSHAQYYISAGVSAGLT